MAAALTALTVAVARHLDGTRDGVTPTESVATDHVHRHVDVVGAGQVAGRAHERVVVQDVEDARHRLEDIVFPHLGVTVVLTVAAAVTLAPPSATSAATTAVVVAVAVIPGAVAVTLVVRTLVVRALLVAVLLVAVAAALVARALVARILLIAVLLTTVAAALVTRALISGALVVRALVAVAVLLTTVAAALVARILLIAVLLVPALLVAALLVAALLVAVLLTPAAAALIVRALVDRALLGIVVARLVAGPLAGPVAGLFLLLAVLVLAVLRRRLVANGPATTGGLVTALALPAPVAVVRAGRLGRTVGLIRLGGRRRRRGRPRLRCLGAARGRATPASTLDHLDELALALARQALEAHLLAECLQIGKTHRGQRYALRRGGCGFRRGHGDPFWARDRGGDGPPRIEQVSGIAEEASGVAT